MFQLEIRFGQLNTAVELEYWQEAYKSVEDIKNTLFVHSKANIPKQMVANYYLQLSKLFMVSKNYIFHAHALAKYAELMQELAEEIDADNSVENNEESEKTVKSDVIKMRLTEAEQITLYSRVLLAALSVPISHTPDDTYSISYDLQKEKESRLGGLLDFDVTLNRGHLLEELVANGIFSKAHKDLEELYNLLEVKFHPFQFCNNLKKHLEFLEKDLELTKYKETILEVGFVKLMQQLSNVYQTLEISQLHKFIPFWEADEIERRLIHTLQSRVLECRIDHKRRVVTFNVNSIESEDMKYKLIEISRNLRKCLALIHPKRREKLKKKDLKR